MIKIILLNVFICLIISPTKAQLNFSFDDLGYLNNGSERLFTFYFTGEDIQEIDTLKYIIYSVEEPEQWCIYGSVVRTEDELFKGQDILSPFNHKVDSIFFNDNSICPRLNLTENMVNEVSVIYKNGDTAFFSFPFNLLTSFDESKTLDTGAYFSNDIVHITNITEDEINFDMFSVSGALISSDLNYTREGMDVRVDVSSLNVPDVFFIRMTAPSDVLVYRINQ